MQISGLAGRTALITGASKGIGRASALAPARAGANVIVNHRDSAAEAEGLAESHSRPVSPHQGWLHTWHLVLARACCPIGECFPKLDQPPGNVLIWTAREGEPEARDGQLTVPERPGFGWTINRLEMERRALA